MSPALCPDRLAPSMVRVRRDAPSLLRTFRQAAPCTGAASQGPNNNSHDNNDDNNNDRTDTVGAARVRTCHFWRSG